MLGLVAGAMLLAAPTAGAATRYASPSGTGPSATCPQSNPCALEPAVEGPGVVFGDDVIVLPGTYTVLAGNELGVPAGVTVEGQPGAPMPTITYAGGASTVIHIDIGTIRRLRFDVSAAGSTGRGVDAVGAASIIEQSVLISRGTGGAALQLRDGATLRDSVAWSVNQGFTPAVLVGGSGGTIQNVTAIANGAASEGILVPAAYGGTQQVTIRNSIARGSGAPDISVTDDSGTDNIDVNVSFSNFGTGAQEPPDAALVLGAGNQTAAPLFAGASTGDVRQTPGSPTINAGTATGISSFDLDGNPRTLCSAADIGADEAPDGSSLLGFDAGKLK